jgi:hypothetical protein
MKRAKGFLWCLFVGVGITLFLAAPATAEWTDPALDTLLILDTEVTVRRPDPACEEDPPVDCFPGGVQTPVLNGSGVQQEQLVLWEIVKVTATLEVTEEMPLPMRIRVVFGGLGYQLAPRDFNLARPGNYSTSAYFLVSGEGDKTIGTKALVQWRPTGEPPSKIDNQLILDQVFVGPLPPPS